MSRRTETAYKAQSPGKSAQHDKAPGSRDRVNAAVVWGKFTSLSGEICLKCGCLIICNDYPVKLPAGATGAPSPGSIRKAFCLIVRNEIK